MMRQYHEIKEQNKDSILFFRMGDFYEMFEEDAKLAAEELDLTLTTRDRNKENPDDRVPMCGVPYHSCEAYIARLIAKGYKVAICEQMEDPATAKGLVSRGVIRVITPGTVIDSSMLEEGRATYICAVYLNGGAGGVCFADISTGEVCATSFGRDAAEHIVNELGRFAPSEIVLSEQAGAHADVKLYLAQNPHCLSSTEDARFDEQMCRELSTAQFGAEDAGDFGGRETVLAVGALFGYLHETQKTDLSYMNTLRLYETGEFMELDQTSRRNLELTETMRNGEKKGSLLWVLDRTKTSMGSRLLRAWISRPLLSPVPIKRRLDAVEELFHGTVVRSELTLTLKEIGDMERLIGKTVYGTANGRDLRAMAASTAHLPTILGLLSPMKAARLQALAQFDPLADLHDLIDRAIAEEPPFSVREGGIIKEGFDAEVDRLRSLLGDSTGALAKIEARERERTGKKLKVGYNKVFGYYIEITRSMSDDVPGDYIRKQTLTNCERFITQELKELESALLTAKDSLQDIEYSIFSDIRRQVADAARRVQDAAAAVAEIDVLTSLAHVAVTGNFTKPEIDDSAVIDIKEGRHPVVEATQRESLFVANDTFLDGGARRVAIITGPNMAGKSTYMRQTALIVLMAQIGSFVPAKSASIGIVDRVFTRIGASDDLAGGQSTFMVEMTEVADILKNATDRSLILLDEIGRGTSTYDGMSIARAVLEYCTKRLKAKTLFATHYHELTALEQELPGVKNYNIAAKKRGDDIIFLRKIVPGGADESYGIEVAKLAGVPDSVIRRAREVLKGLETDTPAPRTHQLSEPMDDQISMTQMGGDEVAALLRETDINTLTPIEAMNLVFQLKKKVDE